MRMNQKSIFGVLFIGVMVVLAVGSGSPPKPPKHKVLAEKYEIAEDEAKFCVETFDKDAEKIISWISKQDNFLGFGDKDCEDLKDEIKEYGDKELLAYALENNLEVDDEAFLQYRAEWEVEAAKKAQEQAEREAKRQAAEAKRKKEQEEREAKREMIKKIVSNLGIGSFNYFGPNSNENDIDRDTAKILCEKAFSVSTKAMKTSLLVQGSYAHRFIANNGGSLTRNRISWIDKEKYGSGGDYCLVSFTVQGLYQGTNHKKTFTGKACEFVVGANQSVSINCLL